MIESLVEALGSNDGVQRVRARERLMGASSRMRSGTPSASARERIRAAR